MSPKINRLIAARKSNWAKPQRFRFNLRGMRFLGRMNRFGESIHSRAGNSAWRPRISS